MRPTIFLYTYQNSHVESTTLSRTVSGGEASPDSAETSQNSFIKDPGLSVTVGFVYNSRQNLPLMTGTLPTAPDGSSLTSEADMKPARFEQALSSVSPSSKTSGENGGETRAERLARIRREIQEGTYDSDEKLERAVERMLGVLHTARD